MSDWIWVATLSSAPILSFSVVMRVISSIYFCVLKDRSANDVARISISSFVL